MIPVSRPHIAETDIQAVSDALREGFVSGEAPIVAAFEQEFASAVTVVTALPSVMAVLHLISQFMLSAWRAATK